MTKWLTLPVYLLTNTPLNLEISTSTRLPIRSYSRLISTNLPNHLNNRGIPAAHFKRLRKLHQLLNINNEI